MNDPSDGEREVSLAGKTEQVFLDTTDGRKLTLAAEELNVTKEAVETGRVRIHKQTHTRDVAVDESLLSEHAEIERIPIGRQIFEAPSVRHEGDTTIIPIVEEILYTERRLILKEEIKITRRKNTENFHDVVTLRYQEAVVTRVPGASDTVDAPSAKVSRSSDSKE